MSVLFAFILFPFSSVMKLHKITLNTILLICIPLFVFGQKSPCNIDPEDSTKCYVSKKYIKPKIILEKKWESLEITSIDQIPLIADMDGDCFPEILLRGINTLDGSMLDTPRVHFFDGRNGKLKVKFDCIGFQPDITPVLVDVDNDGVKEIIMATRGGNFQNRDRIYCYEFTGKLKWISDEYFFSPNFEVTPHLGAADFNQDGNTEIYCNNRIFNGQTGKLLVEGGLNGIGAHDEGYIWVSSVTVAGNLDEDQKDLELAAGFTIYKVRLINLNGLIGNSMTPTNMKLENSYFDGKTAITDINVDGMLDVVVAHGDRDVKSKLYAYTLNNGVLSLIANNFIPGINTAVSCPSIADVDGNQIPNIIVSKTNSIYNFEFDGTNILQLKWSLRVQDTVSGTGITTFDFNGDGISEIIYRDHFNLMIIDGSVNPPQIIDSIKCRAGTYNEYPSIADINYTGKAQICIICGGKGQFPINITKGTLIAFGSPDSLPGWAPARAVWNQYAYNPLYINDDLTVPKVPKNQASYKNGKYNNFLQQESLLDSNGMYKVAAANLQGEINCINYDPIAEEYNVSFNVFNLKNASARVDTGLPVSFYNGDPTTGGNLLGIFYSPTHLNPGDSLLKQEFNFKAVQLQDLHMVVNTKRDTIGVFDPKDFSALECDYSDNVFHTTEFPKTIKISASICKGSTYPFFDTMLTHMGLYTHTVRNQKNCDSLITLLELSVLDTIHTSQSLSVCDSFSWNGLVYRENGTFINHFQATNACDSVVSLNLNIRHSSDTLIQTSACRKFGFNDKVYTAGGKYLIKLRNRQGCDSLIELDLNIIALDTNITKLGNTLIALDSQATYQWVDCNDHFEVIPGATDKIFIPNKDGTYAVIISSPPCTDTSFCLPFILSTTFHVGKQGILVYPNPATNQLSVKFLNPITGVLRLMIKDLHGRCIMHKVLTTPENQEIDIAITDLAQGLYSLSIQSETGSNQLIFIKM